MASGEFTGLDTKDDVNYSAPAALIVEKDQTIRIGRPGPLLDRRDCAIAIDCNSEPLLRSGVTITSALLELTISQSGSGFAQCDFEVRELDPEADLNDWYRDGTNLAHREAIWRGAHNMDMLFRVELLGVQGIIITNFGINETPWTPGELYLKRFAPLAGQLVGLHHEIGSYFKTPAFGGASNIRNIRLRLKRVGTFTTEVVTMEVWETTAGGGGKYNQTPSVKLTQVSVAKRVLVSSLSDTVFQNTEFEMGTGELEQNRSYMFKLIGDWAADGTRYIISEAFGTIGGDNETQQGSDCALMLYGEEERMNTQNYPDGLNVEDLAISSPVVTYGITSPLFIPVGDTVDGTDGGGGNGDLVALLQKAVDRPGWDANKRFGLQFSAENTIDGQSILPAWQGEGGGFDPPTLKVTWTDYELPTIDNLPPFPPAEIPLGVNTTFTVEASSTTGLDLVFSIIDPPEGLGGPASIDPDTGFLQWNPLFLSEVSGGPAFFQIVVTDEVGGTDSASFDVFVVETGAPLPVEPVPLVDQPGKPNRVQSAGTGEIRVSPAGVGSARVQSVGTGQIRVGDAGS